MHSGRLSLFPTLIPLILCLHGNASAGDQAGGPRVRVSGFVSATVFAQDRSFAPGNGQKSLWAAPGPRGEDPWFSDFDVRNTRLCFTADVPYDETLAFKGHIEADFFGGFTGSGHVSDEMPMPRLRLAYADVKWQRTTLRVGQYWNPLFGYVPVSPTHVAFPLGYASAGMIGWRFPGIYLYQDLTGPEGELDVQLQLGVFRGSWDGPGDNLDSLSAGNASMVPQIDVRLNVGTRDKKAPFFWQAFAVGHYDRKDLSGVGAVADDDSLDAYAGAVGWKLKFWRLFWHGNAYVGRAIGNQVAHILQIGDIKGWGIWNQLGVKITDILTVYLFYGVDNPDDDDVLAAFPDPDAKPRLFNHTGAVTLRFTVGPYQFGAEWMHGELRHSRTRKWAVGNHFSASALFKF